MTTLAQALQAAQAHGLGRLDAQLLLARTLGRPRTWLLAHDDAALTAPQAEAYFGDVARRAAGEPLAYIVGEKEFHGLPLQVNASVLVPRPETETLVDWALQLLRGEFSGEPAPRVVDLGTGSGAIALAVKHAHGAARLTAVDCSAEALDVAASNAARLGLELRLLRSRWWDAVAGERFHLALGNPPYVADGDPHLAALAHEPRLALTAGRDGLDALRCIIGPARACLEPAGWLLLEHGHDQGGAVSDLLAQAGFVDLQPRCDAAGTWRCTGGRGPVSG